MHTLVETKALAGDRGATTASPAKVHERSRCRPTVQAVLAARIDRLPIEAKRLLQAAAVIGKDVPLALLHAIADMPEEALRRNLAQLQSGEFLYEISLFPSVEYTFKHALTHDVAYCSLLQERRRALHARVVDGHRAPLRRPPGRAGRAAGPPRGARRGVGQGGRRICARPAPRRRRAPPTGRRSSLLEQALSALAHLPEGRAASRAGHRPAPRPAARRCCSWASSSACSSSRRKRRRWPRSSATSSAWRACTPTSINYHYLKGEPDLAIEYGERCLRIGDAAGDVGAAGARPRLPRLQLPRPGPLHRRASSSCAQNVEALELAQGEAPGGQSGISYVTSSGWLAFTLAELGDFDAAAMSLDRRAAGGRGERPRLHPDHRADPGRARVAAARPARAGAPAAAARASTPAARRTSTCGGPFPSSLLGLTLRAARAGSRKGCGCSRTACT